MRYVFVSVVCIMFLYLSCTDKDCHAYVNIANQSDRDVIATRIWRYPDNSGCEFYSVRLAPNESWDYKPYRACIERHMPYFGVIEVYIMGVESFGGQLDSHYAQDCSSLVLENDILEHYEISKDSLISSGFRIIYR